MIPRPEYYYLIPNVSFLALVSCYYYYYYSSKGLLDYVITRGKWHVHASLCQNLLDYGIVSDLACARIRLVPEPRRVME